MELVFADSLQLAYWSKCLQEPQGSFEFTILCKFWPIEEKYVKYWHTFQPIQIKYVKWNGNTNDVIYETAMSRQFDAISSFNFC